MTFALQAFLVSAALVSMFQTQVYYSSLGCTFQQYGRSVLNGAAYDVAMRHLLKGMAWQAGGLVAAFYLGATT